jgi:tryptophan 2,3-dioxygenase
MAENPIYHSKTLTYGSYLKIPELLSLQTPKTDHPDELLFIQAHQVYELWFKQMLHELTQICRFLDADKPLRAAQLFERVHLIQHLLIEQIPLIESMFSTEFAKFRDALRPASGFQSVQFRKLEFLCGNKNPKMLALVGEDEAARAEMATYLDKPTIYDHFLWHLAREDDNVFKIPARFLKGARDTSQPHQAEPELVSSLEILYRIHNDAQRAGNTERYYPQFRVAEHLLSFDEKTAIWRFHHVKMVERMIGGGSGTGGSSGAKYLASTIKPFFPDLWAVRDKLNDGAPYAATEGGGCPMGHGAPPKPAGGGCPMGH